MPQPPEPRITLLLALAGLAVLAAVLLPRTEVRTPGVSLLRVLIPSWRFFDGIGAAPELFMRTGPSADAYGPWTPVIVVPPRTWHAVLWNPDGNVALAKHTLLERLQHDLEAPDGAAPATLVSYQLVLHLVRSALPIPAAPGVVQFRLVLRDTAADPATSDLLLSDHHPC